MVLTEVDFKKALKVLTGTERHMKKTFAGFGRNKFAVTMHKIGEMVRQSGEIQIKDIIKEFYYDADDTEMATILATLESAGKLKIVRRDASKFRDQYLVWNKIEEVNDVQ